MTAPAPCLLCGVHPSETGAQVQEGRCPTCGLLLPGAGPLEAHLQDLKTLLGRGERINAIRLYRGLTREGLAEAKEVVERLERGEELPLRALERLTAPPPPAPDGEVERLLITGQKIAAIKMQRQLTGWGLKEAQAAVEALEQRLRLTEGRDAADESSSSKGRKWLFVAGGGAALVLMYFGLR